MKVILLENVRKVGSIGEVIDVKEDMQGIFDITKRLFLHQKKTLQKLKKLKMS